MPLFAETGAIGPLRWAWRPYRRGAEAETSVRSWLAVALGSAPAALPLVRDGHGRPRFDAPFTHHDLGWSHSGDGLLIAFGEAVEGKPIELGVDLERLRPRPRALDLARRFFTADEANWLAALPEDARTLAFVRLWCAKEAVLKAHGRGLAFGLDRLGFGERGGQLRLISCDPALGSASDWNLHEFAPQPDYRAVLAWRARP